MKIVLTLILVLLPTYALSAQNTARNIPMTQASWTAAPERAEFITHRGVPAVKVTPSPEALFAKSGQVVLNDVQFSDGTIEFDVEITDFFLSAIYFRHQDTENAEVFYLRTYRAGDPTGPDAIQYTTLIKGVALWDVHPKYQTAAIIHKEGWNHIKLVISGQRMHVYVNNMSGPTMEIPQLLGPSGTGSIALEGGGIFANLVIKPGVTEGLSPEAGFDPISKDIRYVHQWEITEPFALPPGRELVSAMLFNAYSDHYPTENTRWQPVSSEHEALINISRKYGKSEDRRAVWLKKTIHSNSEQVRQMNLGFSDEVWVLLNERLVYVGKNLYSHPIMKDPFGQISIHDASFSLPLQEGDNTLLVGVANSLFGWAILARLENPDGVTFK